MPEPQRGVYTPQGIPKPRAQVAQQPQPGSRTSSSQPTGGRQRASFSSEQGGQWMASSPRLGRGPAASSRAATRPKGSMVRTKMGHRRGERARERAARDPEAAPSAFDDQTRRARGQGAAPASRDGAGEVSKHAGAERAWPPRRCAASSARPSRRRGQGAERLPGTSSGDFIPAPWPHPQRRPRGGRAGAGEGELEWERRPLGGGGAGLSLSHRYSISKSFAPQEKKKKKKRRLEAVACVQGASEPPN